MAGNFEGKLRIFFSVDVAGSTAYKTRKSEIESYDTHWARFYQKFLRDFSTSMLGKTYQGEQPESDSSKALKGLGIWKMLGDEILFSAEIFSASDAFVLTRTFYELLCKYDDYYRKEKYFLRLKGAGWTAGFPIRNAEISLPNVNVVDYIGPDIDIGFRLCQTARPGRMVVSMDLAELLIENQEHDQFGFHHVGWEAFKGVFGGRPYPIIWVTTSRPPYILPWESRECVYTKAYQTDAAIAPEKLQKLISDMREALPELRLFKPYFCAEDMPLWHREYAGRWYEEEKRREGQETFDQGQDANEAEIQ